MSDLKNQSTTETLGELLTEAKMQVTFTGWKAELELTEQKLIASQKEIERLKKHVEILKAALEKYANPETHAMDETGFIWSSDYCDYETARKALKECEGL